MSATHADITWGSLTVKQVASVNFNPDVQVTQDHATGNPTVAAVHVGQAAPKVQISSTDLETILAVSNFATAGLNVSSGTITLPWNVRATGAAYASGSSHIKIAATNGLLVPQSLQADQGGIGTLSMEGTLIATDGQTAPASYAGSQSLVSGSFNALYRLYSASFGGSGVAGLVGVTINFGINTVLDYFDGATYPNAVYIESIKPSIDLRFRNQAAINTLGPVFQTMTAAVVKFAKQAPGGTIVAALTAEHVSFTFADGVAHPTQIGGQGMQISEPTIRLTGESLTVSTTATL